MDPPAESKLSAPARDKTSVTPPQLPRAKIVLWGDSLTQTSFEGWGGALANRYQRRADVINRGMSGYNTKWFKELPDEIHEYVALCTIWFGANDASLEDLNPHHFVSLEDFQDNLREIVRKAQTLMGGDPKFLMITCPPVDHDQRLAFQKQRYGDMATGKLERTLENSGKYASACEAVAKEFELPCLNLWEAFQAQDNWARFLHDGLHFSQEGHTFVFEQLIQKIKEEFPELHVEPDPITGQACNSGSKCEALHSFGPYHDEIDESNPDAAMKAAFANMAEMDLAHSASMGNSPTSKKPKTKMDAP